ncbi:MAG: TldD/PmbA family protein [Promethearchaeota archaeon]
MAGEVDIHALARFGLEHAERVGSNLDSVEIFYSKSRYLTIEIEENSIKHSQMGIDEGISIRVINKNGSMGFAYTNRLNKKIFIKIINDALKLMHLGTGDLDYKCLPSSYKNYPNVKDLFDKQIEHLTLEDAMGKIKSMITVCEEDEQAISQSGELSTNSKDLIILNSNGLEIEGKKTLVSVSSEIVVKDKTTKDSSSGFEWQSVRKLKDLRIQETAEKALSNAKRNLNRKKIKSMKAPVILTPKGVINLILNPLSSAVNGETFQYKRSFLVGKRGEKIGSNLLTIKDEGLIPGATGSSKFDGEGVPCQNKVILEKGTFLKEGLLHNSYTAGKEGIESTGNASRNSYARFPSIGITNFILEPGTASKEELLTSIKRGIWFEYTGDSPNIATGDFSGLILMGNLILDGEIKTPLNETMIGINLLDLFKKISMVSKEIEIYGPYRAPYVKIEDVNIIGSG